MNPLFQAFFEAAPFLLAFGLFSLLPTGRSWAERLAVGAVAGLVTLFVSSMWPGAEAEAPAAGHWPHLLNLVLLLPLVGGVGILFLPRQSPKLLKRYTLAVLGLDFIVSLFLLKVTKSTGWQLQYIHDWVPSFGIRYHVAVDGISTWMVLLSTFSTPIAAIVSFGSVQKRIKDLCFALLILHGAMIGAFISLDLFLFFVFWELMLLPMLILIGVFGGVERIKAAYKFFLYTMVGSMMMLAAILYMVWTHHQLAGYWTFDYLALSHLVLPKTAAWLCFFGFALAFLIKVPMFPFHTWLPDAHVQAPTGGSIILAAVLLKLGTYGYIRFCMGMLGGPAGEAGTPLASVVIVLGIVYGALIAWKQDDVKRLVAYSSVAHMGYVMLGLFAANRAGVEGAILQMLNHGVSTGALFLLVGVIYDRRHTRLVKEFGGIAQVMPVYTVLFIVVTMSSIGVPGTNGFVGEFMIIMGTFLSEHLGPFSHLQGILASSGVILAAVYMLSVVQKVFFGPLTNQKNAHLEDINVRESIAIAPLIAMIFVIGFFPSLFLSRMTPSVEATLDRFREHRTEFTGQTDSSPARLLARKGGPLEVGYPEAPGAAAAAPEGAVAQADRAQKGAQ
ncbi:MAG TPA: NADH-quinone oxidoreductase subunit M [Polyangiaceae bacterium]|nr:NADH-quinone oxidoreductase subunit M [Polyangiaceae bacterium]